MKNSFLINLIKKNINKRHAARRAQILANRKEINLFLNSNPWFSAVSDYSLQIALYLKSQKEEVLYGAHVGHTKMNDYCRENLIPFFHIPINRINFFTFLISFFKIIFVLSSKKYKVKRVFAFEGREHTLLVLAKFLFPFLWYQVELIRIRAQSKGVKKTFFSLMSYKYYSDKVIFAAQCVKDRFQFELRKGKGIVQLYCKDISFKETKLSRYSFSSELPVLNFQDLTFLELGRFDPVKGHHMALKSFLNSDFKKKTQLIFIGKSENVLAKDLFEEFSRDCDKICIDANKYYLQKGHHCVYIIDERFQDIYSLIQNCHFGLITSLDSEVVCRVGVEFLQSGVPCIYSNAGALPEVFCEFPELQFEKGIEEKLIEKFLFANELFSDSIKYENAKILAKKIGDTNYIIGNLKNILENS